MLSFILGLCVEVEFLGLQSAICIALVDTDKYSHKVVEAIYIPTSA